MSYNNSNNEFIENYFDKSLIEDEKETITVSFKVPANSYRKTKKDYIYYNSDLNKYIGLELIHDFTSIDCDLFQYRRNMKKLRLAEYKHENESLTESQNEALREIARLFKWAMIKGYDRKLECHLIRGNYPYAKIKIKDFITNTTYQLENDDVKDYLILKK